MNEHFLHFVWRNRLYISKNFCTQTGKSIEILEPGVYNRDSGPDFVNAKIIIDGTLWAGNVEIHHKSSMWDDHKHNHDAAYNSVILHVVSIFDRIIKTKAGVIPETFVMVSRSEVSLKYQQYMLDSSLIVCRKDLHKIDKYFIRHWLHGLAVDRLRTRTELIEKLLLENKGDWEETLYILIAENIGMKVNRDTFSSLARRTPLKLIRKHSDDLIQVEALLFGQAGMLGSDIYNTKTSDEYFDLLAREYLVLGPKYSLSPMSAWEWKFHRMRPANFPTIRISQLSAMIAGPVGLFSQLVEAKTTDDLYSLLRVESSEYWHNHYRFGMRSENIPKITGRNVLDSILINAVIPVLFLYGQKHTSNEICDRSLDLLDSLNAENNRITREWTGIGVEPVSALESQAIIELTNRLCKNRDCLNCHIGSKLISLGEELDPRGNHFLEESR